MTQERGIPPRPSRSASKRRNSMSCRMRRKSREVGAEHPDGTSRTRSRSSIGSPTASMSPSPMRRQPRRYLARLAAREVKVVLSGDGAMKRFTGYTRYAHAAHRQRSSRSGRRTASWGATIDRLCRSGFREEYPRLCVLRHPRTGQSSIRPLLRALRRRLLQRVARGRRHERRPRPADRGLGRIGRSRRSCPTTSCDACPSTSWLRSTG